VYTDDTIISAIYEQNTPAIIRDMIIEANIWDGYNHTWTALKNLYVEAYLPFKRVTVDESRVVMASDAFTFELASENNDASRWMVNNNNLLVGTENAEWVVPAGVTATNLQAGLNSRHGSTALQARAVGGSVVFFKSGGKGIVEYYIPEADSFFRSNNLAAMSRGMLEESAALDFDFVSAPNGKILIVRKDGTMAALLYDRSLGVFAWSRVTTFAGHTIVSVATMPGADGFDDIFLVVKRGSYYYLEVLEAGKRVFLDSYKLYATADKANYPGGRVVDVNTGKWWEVTASDLPAAGAGRYVGYPYESRVRTMPILANDQIKKNRISGLVVRFLKSALPLVTSIAQGRVVGTDTITGLSERLDSTGRFTGVHKMPFPGTWDEDVQVEFIHNEPVDCRILSINAEVM
jgi:hypothetical protein